MGIYRYTLDATALNTDPIGWDIQKTGYGRAIDSRGVMSFRPEGDLTFIEDGYDYIKAQEDAYGLCHRISLTVEYKEWTGGSFATIFIGEIHMTDLEWDLEFNWVKVAQVRDADYYSVMNSNSGISAVIDVGRSKNDETITAAATTNIDFHSVAGGAHIYPARPSFLIYDVLEFLVAFCSDGTLQFDSSYFGAGGDGEGMILVMGSTIRTGTGAAIQVSWDTLQKELFRKLNVVPVVDDSTSPTTIRMEIESTTYEQTVSTSFTGDEIKGLKRRAIPFSISPNTYNGDRPIGLFTNLKLGSNTTKDTGAYPNVQFKGWNAEEYFIAGDCGSNQTLDLQTDFVVDSNVIEDCLGGTTTYDDQIFMVETDYPTFSRTSRFTVISPGAPPYSYNDGFTNENVALRFLGAIPNSIAAYLGDGADGFQAEKTGTTSSIGGTMDINPADFNDDFTPPNNDPNGNYSNATYRYTAPSNGFYVFRAIVSYSNVVIDPVAYPSFDSTVTIRRYDSGGTLLDSRVDVVTVSSDRTLTYSPSGFYCNATDYVDVRIQGSTNGPGPGVASWDCDQAFFLTTALSNSGGIWQTFDPTTFRGYYYQFQAPMSFADYIAMISYPTRYDAIFVNRGGSPDDITGWLVSVQFDLGTNTATIELATT